MTDGSKILDDHFDGSETQFDDPEFGRHVSVTGESYNMIRRKSSIEAP